MFDINNNGTEAWWTSDLRTNTVAVQELWIGQPWISQPGGCGSYAGVRSCSGLRATWWLLAGCVSLHQQLSSCTGRRRAHRTHAHILSNRRASCMVSALGGISSQQQGSVASVVSSLGYSCDPDNLACSKCSHHQEGQGPGISAYGTQEIGGFSKFFLLQLCSCCAG